MVLSDTESGILQAVKDDANCLWANTILFSELPMQTSPNIGQYANLLTAVGQPPRLVQAYDDKNLVNSLLRKTVKNDLQLPIVAKPI